MSSKSSLTSWLQTLAATAVLSIACVLLIKFEKKNEHRRKKELESRKRTLYDARLPKGSNLIAPEPGKLIRRGFRSTNPICRNDFVRIVTWNIERGYRINEIIKALKKENADIILLQEVDIGCKRTNMLDIGNEIANALQFQIIYGADCWHVNYEIYDKDMRFNALPHDGCEGNAILTRFNVNECWPVHLPCVRNQYRPKHDHMKRHTAICALIDTQIPNMPALLCYSLHFDAFSGRCGRAKVQYKAIYKHLSRMKLKNKDCAVIVGGDFNSHNHGVARFVNELSGDDALRFKYFGLSEAEWWHQNVIGKEHQFFDDLLLENIVNLEDPFDKTKDVTFSKVWRGLNVWNGKIDWLLHDVDRLSVVDKYVSNIDVSDHQYLRCDYGEFCFNSHAAVRGRIKFCSL